jgi:hypothetical protein
MLSGGRHTHLRDRGWADPIPTTFHKAWYSVYHNYLYSVDKCVINERNIEFQM